MPRLQTACNWKRRPDDNTSSAHPRWAESCLAGDMLRVRAVDGLWATLLATRAVEPRASTVVGQVRRRSNGRSIRTGFLESTAADDRPKPEREDVPFIFDAGYALFAKRPPRPFPPPFHSSPSGSFSDPLSTHDRSQDRESLIGSSKIKGVTNGDDAVLISENFIGAADGVGAWATKEQGHASYAHPAR